MKVLLVAGTHKGVGKTTVCVGLISYLRFQGHSVQPFKVGPDCQDALALSHAAGRDAVSLDGWVLTPEQLIETFHRCCEGADYAIIEARASLFDEVDGAPETTSSSAVARTLACPVVVVASSVSRYTAAALRGLDGIDPDIEIAGLLLTDVTDTDPSSLEAQLAAYRVPFPLLGVIPRRDGAALPRESDLSRVLFASPRGTALTGERFNVIPADAPLQPFVTSLRTLVGACHRITALAAAGSRARPPPAPRGSARRSRHPPKVRIAVAADAAFWRYQCDNLRLLEAHGAELVPFSPLADSSLPEDVHVVYVGSGPIREHLGVLSGNATMRATLAAFAQSGGVVLAEGAGMTYLSEWVEVSADGTRERMCGVLPVSIVVTGRSTCGYVEVVTRSNPLFQAGSVLRGFVDHNTDVKVGNSLLGLWEDGDGWSLARRRDFTLGFKVQLVLGVNTAKERSVEEGVCVGTVLASQVVLHWASSPRVAADLVERAARVRPEAVARAVDAARNAAATTSAAPGPHAPGSLLRRRSEGAALPPLSGAASAAHKPISHARHGSHAGGAHSAWAAGGRGGDGDGGDISGTQSGRTSLGSAVVKAGASLLGWGWIGGRDKGEGHASMDAGHGERPGERTIWGPNGAGMGGVVEGSGGAVSPHGLRRAGLGHIKKSYTNLSGLNEAGSRPESAPGTGSVFPIPIRGELRHRAAPSSPERPPERSGSAGSLARRSFATGPRDADLPLRVPSEEAIVTLFPGATEVVFSLGLGARVCATSDRCDFPPECSRGRHVAAVFRSGARAGGDALGLSDTASVSGVSVGSDGTRRRGSSQGAHGSRWDGKAGGLASEDEVVWVDTDWLLRERPGLVVAPVLSAHPDAHAMLHQAGLVDLHGESLVSGITIVQVAMSTLNDSLAAISEIGRAAGVGDRAAQLEDKLRERLVRIARDVRRKRQEGGRPPKVLLLRAASPPLAGGEWRPELVSLAGGVSMLQPRDTSEYVSWETVRDFNPDIILIAPDRSCPDQAASLDGIGDLAHHKGWWSIRAVWENDVFVLAAGAEDLVNRPGPRMVDAVEALAHVLNWDSSRRVSVLPRGSLLKLKLQKGGRCRAKNLINFFNKV